MDSVKKDLLDNIKRFPSRYAREEMYDYISYGVLTKEDLVYNNDILTEEAFIHIKKYPRIVYEHQNLPVMNHKPESKRGNVDILPFGTSGSGGKTCLLAALMTLFDNKEFVLHETPCSEYARQLSGYMFHSFLPPATLQNYLQVIDTSLRVEECWYGLSFVEFSGESAVHIAELGDRAFAGNSEYYPICRIMNNGNPKVLLLSIDLTNKKNIPLWVDGQEFHQWVPECDIAELWASRLEKDRSFCKKILAIKIIVTKSDVLNVTTTQQAINALVENGYKVFYDRIVELCHKYKIMGFNDFMPEVIPFSIGKFMPGDVFTFDNSDARKLLDSIKRDLDLNHYGKGILSKMKNIMKKW